MYRNALTYWIIKTTFYWLTTDLLYIIFHILIILLWIILRNFVANLWENLTEFTVNYSSEQLAYKFFIFYINWKSNGASFVITDIQGTHTTKHVHNSGGDLNESLKPLLDSHSGHSSMLVRVVTISRKQTQTYKQINEEG